ncbi:MAG: SMP-30/gluconolactonase/LRE family protein [Verrucomicrobia bacterium]|nr:SMP-30/gluconolactonase/LRE family protein [Verrucomicrobiota bacterium]
MRYSLKFFLISVLTDLTALSSFAAHHTLDDLVAPGAEVEVIAESFVFTEGPVWDGKGNLLFSDVRVNKIMRLGADGKVSLFIDDIGTNGLYFDNDGFLIVCGNLRDRVLYRILGDGSREILADRIDGKRLNAPNDCWVDPEGGIYFSDPRYRTREVMELDNESLYYLSPKGELQRVDADYTRPNGLIGTPDGKILYVADYGAGHINKYTIEKGGVLKNKTMFTKSISDSMTLDEHGNLYLTKEVVAVYRPNGSLIGEIKLPSEGGSTTNATFGGADRKTLYITGGTRLMKLDMQVAGVAR